MEARVKEKSRISTVTAGGGQYFVKPEWSHVEPGTEAEIKASEFLDIRKDPVAVDEAKPKAKGKSKSKKKAAPENPETEVKPESEPGPELEPLPDPPKPSTAIKSSSGDSS